MSRGCGGWRGERGGGGGSGRGRRREQSTVATTMEGSGEEFWQPNDIEEEELGRGLSQNFTPLCARYIYQGPICTGGS